jgi:hypothetical protein
MILIVNRDYFPNSVNQLMFVIVKCCVFFAVRTELFKYYLDELWLQSLISMKEPTDKAIFVHLPTERITHS